MRSLFARILTFVTDARSISGTKRCTSRAHPALVKYARDIVALSVSYNEALLMRLDCAWPTSACIIAATIKRHADADIRPLLDSKPRPFNTIFMEELHAKP